MSDRAALGGWKTRLGAWCTWLRSGQEKYQALWPQAAADDASSPRVLSPGRCRAPGGGSPGRGRGVGDVEGEGEEGSGSEDSAESIEPYDHQQLDEDLYGVCISSGLRDLRKILIGHGDFWLRSSRLLAHVALLVGLLTFQLYLIAKVKSDITPEAVEHMRTQYQTFEEVMSAGDGGRSNETAWSQRFDALSHETKDQICSMPLAHPFFLFSILCIWTTTVIVDLRKTVFLTRLMAFKTPTVSSVYDIFEHDEAERHGRPRRDDGKVVLVGLTVGLKLVLVLCVFVPRLVVDSTLLWLGCRWLLATDNLQDVFLNAVALEFVLMLKDLAYVAIIPMRNKVETVKLSVPINLMERASYQSFLGAFLWLVLGLAWVLLYLTELQRVLPNYQWDVRTVCRSHGHL